MPRTKAFTDDELLKEMRASEDRFVTAPELAEAFNVTAQAVRNRLDRLYDAERVEKKRVGSGTGWWVVDT